MFLHLCDDEKFIDSARRSFDLADHGSHLFAVIGSGPPFAHIRTFKPEVVSDRESIARSFLHSLPSYEGVYLHSLNRANRRVLYHAPSANFVWIGWGFDYYHLITDRDRLLLERTKLILRGDAEARARLGRRNSLRRWATDPFERLYNLVHGPSIRPGGAGEIQSLGKLAAFAPVLRREHDLIEQRNPGIAPRFLSWNYGVHDALQLAAGFDEEKAERAVVGNSATPECNHLDAFAWLEECEFKGEVCCPLSYGDARYRASVIEAGTRSFGRLFRPILDFMDLPQYARLIAGSTHLVMFHLRQQGLTNILMALQAGCRVITLPQNPLTSHLLENGLSIAGINSGLPPPVPKDVATANKTLVDMLFGAATHANRTTQFIRDTRALSR